VYKRQTYGIYATNSLGLNITNSRIEVNATYAVGNMAHGIYLLDDTGEDYGSYSLVANTILVNSSANATGIIINTSATGSSSSHELSRNSILVNASGATGYAYGVRIYNPGVMDSLTMGDNNITVNCSWGWGMFVEHSGTSLRTWSATGNILTVTGSNTTKGIEFESTTTITSNTFSGNTISVTSYTQGAHGYEGTGLISGALAAVFSSNTITGETMTVVGHDAAYAIELYWMNTSNLNDITANTITATSDAGEVYCIALQANNTVSTDLNDNVLTATSSTTNAYGIWYLNDGNTTTVNIDNITINSTGTAGFGIVMNDDGGNMTGIVISHGTVNASGVAIKILGGDDGTITNMTALGGDYGVWLLEAAAGNTIDDSTITGWADNGALMTGACVNNTYYNSTMSGANEDVNVSASSTNQTFINCTYTTEGVGPGSSLNYGWFLDVNVTYSDGGAVSNQHVYTFNRTNGSEGRGVTGSGGIATLDVFEYTNESGNVNKYSNYTVNTTDRSTVYTEEDVNMTDNTLINITVGTTPIESTQGSSGGVTGGVFGVAQTDIDILFLYPPGGFTTAKTVFLIGDLGGDILVRNVGDLVIRPELRIDGEITVLGPIMPREDYSLKDIELTCNTAVCSYTLYLSYNGAVEQATFQVNRGGAAYVGTPMLATGGGIDGNLWLIIISIATIAVVGLAIFFYKK